MACADAPFEQCALPRVEIRIGSHCLYLSETDIWLCAKYCSVGLNGVDITIKIRTNTRNGWQRSCQVDGARLRPYDPAFANKPVWPEDKEMILKLCTPECGVSCDPHHDLYAV